MGFACFVSLCSDWIVTILLSLARRYVRAFQMLMPQRRLDNTTPLPLPVKPNPQIKVVNVQSRPGELSALLRGLEGSAIIYVLTKKEAEQLTADVRKPP